MQKRIILFGLSLLMFAAAGNAQAQTADSATEFKPVGKLWGYAFGDLAYKGGSDEANRGGSNQYTNVPLNSNMFQWRRIYLGYNYEISKKFVAEFLLAAEDDWAAGVMGQAVNTFDSTTSKGSLKTNNVKLGGNGDVLMNTKFSPYIKLANIRWKNIFKNTDLVIGQAPTPGFAQGSAMGEYARNTQTSEEVWGYRSAERTISDIRRTPSFDFGATLQGWFDNKGNYGYDLMVGNGQSAKPENDMYKWFYGNVYAKFMDKKLVVDLYQDYEKLNWGVWVKGPNGNWNHDRNMTKLFVAYTVPKLTVGVEYFMNTILGDVKVTGADKNTYYRTSSATGMSFFVKGRAYKDKLGFFARYDNYDPSGNLSSIVNDKNTLSYSASTATYDPTTKEQFITFGLDFTPMKKIHIMPNVWINTYTAAVSPTGTDKNSTVLYSKMNSAITGNPTNGTDVVYRLTFYYIYGK